MSTIEDPAHIIPNGPPNVPNASPKVEGVVSLESVLRPDVVSALSAKRELRATGFDPFDTALGGGFAPEELVILAGRPGVGKSVAVVQWARNLARSGRSVTLVCYEHSELVMIAQLLLLELGQLVGNAVDSSEARYIVDDLIQGRRTWDETVGGHQLLGKAADRLAAYAPNLSLVDTNGRSAGFELLRNTAQNTDILIVDHLGKVDGSGIGRTAARCKELAIEHGLTVIATTLVTDAGVAARRVRSSSLVDAAMVSHESDIELLLNDKLTIVSKNHTAFDSVRADSFRSQVVFSVEKNRRGVADIDIEFRRDFAHRRFVPTGAFVTERLVDDVLTTE